MTDLHSPAADTRTTDLPDHTLLQAALDTVHTAGATGVFAEVRAGDQTWQGAAGVADTETDAPVAPTMRQRVGSLTKTFVAAAVLQLVEQGEVDLDAPIARHLPHLVPGERGEAITVRMLLNHTSGIAEYLPRAFPSLTLTSLPDATTESLDDNRFRRFEAQELIRMGLDLPGGEPGATPGIYSNSNYFLLAALLEQVTGTAYDDHVARHVIAPAGLGDTGFPAEPEIEGPHPRMYEALFGLADPPPDYSVYDMSWVAPGAGLVSTMPDLNRFYARLLAGEVVGPDALAAMQSTVPVTAQDGSRIDYGLGLHRFEVPRVGTCWGHDGTVWGAWTLTLVRADGSRQLSVTTNLVRWNKLDAIGRPRPHPIDGALTAFRNIALAAGG